MSDSMSDSEWLDWRRKGIGASDVPGILGLSPWAGPYSVWAVKVGLAEAPEQTEQMWLGKHAEAMISSILEERYGTPVVDQQKRCEHPEHRWRRATLDGILNHDEPTIVEMKTTSQPPEEWAASGPLGVPDHYLAQVAWQMHVTGLDRAIVAVIHADRGLTFREHSVTRDDVAALIDWAVEACTLFWESYVLPGVPPPVDSSTASTDVLNATPQDPDSEPVELDDVEHLVRELLMLKKHQRETSDRVSELENIVRARLGGATVGTIRGVPVVTWREETRTTVSTKDLKSSHPDLYASLAKSSTTRVLRWGREAERLWAGSET